MIKIQGAFCKHEGDGDGKTNTCKDCNCITETMFTLDNSDSTDDHESVVCEDCVVFYEDGSKINLPFDSMKRGGNFICPAGKCESTNTIREFVIGKCCAEARKKQSSSGKYHLVQYGKLVKDQVENSKFVKEKANAQLILAKEQREEAIARVKEAEEKIKDAEREIEKADAEYDGLKSFMNSITIKDPFSLSDSSSEDLTDTEKTDESDDSFIDALLNA